MQLLYQKFYKQFWGENMMKGKRKEGKKGEKKKWGGGGEKRRKKKKGKK